MSDSRGPVLVEYVFVVKLIAGGTVQSKDSDIGWKAYNAHSKSATLALHLVKNSGSCSSVAVALPLRTVAKPQNANLDCAKSSRPKKSNKQQKTLEKEGFHGNSVCRRGALPEVGVGRTFHRCSAGYDEVDLLLCDNGLNGLQPLLQDAQVKSANLSVGPPKKSIKKCIILIHFGGRGGGP